MKSELVHSRLLRKSDSGLLYERIAERLEAVADNILNFGQKKWPQFKVEMQKVDAGVGLP